MKALLIFFAFVFPASQLVYGKSNGASSGGTHAVKGHIKKNGTYVRPHRATNPNDTQKGNWTSKPNVNPYTGKPGTKEVEK